MSKVSKSGNAMDKAIAKATKERLAKEAKEAKKLAEIEAKKEAERLAEEAEIIEIENAENSGEQLEHEKDVVLTLFKTSGNLVQVMKTDKMSYSVWELEYNNDLSEVIKEINSQVSDPRFNSNQGWKFRISIFGEVFDYEFRGKRFASELKRAWEIEINRNSTLMRPRMKKELIKENIKSMGIGRDSFSKLSYSVHLAKTGYQLEGHTPLMIEN